MPTPARPKRSRRGTLSRESVLNAALVLADEGGLDSLTMHAIGRRLGVQAMSLYRHVENKEDLLDGLIDLVVSEVEMPRGSADWRAAMRQRAISARRVFARHPWAIGLVESQRHPRAVTLRHHEWVLGVLLEAGFSVTMAGHAYSLLDSYIYGFALQEASLTYGTPEEHAAVGQATLQQVPPDEYPHLARVAREFIEAGTEYGAGFEFGLELILDGIERAQAEADPHDVPLGREARSTGTRDAAP
jgi:AcrR family transcriptional regulator